MKYIGRKRKWICLLSILLVFGLSGCSMQRSEKVTHVDTAMGTIVQQTLYINQDVGILGNAEYDDIENILPQEIMTLLNALEQNTLSWREETSEIYQINSSDSAKGYLLSQDMQEYLNVISDVWNKSDSALDVTIGKVTRLWDIDTWAQLDQDAFSVPEVPEIQTALTDTGFEKVRIDERKIFMPEKMQLDLGAVGKGIACDEVLELLKQQEKVSGAVISIGGSILTYGEKPDGSSWKVAIQHPRESGVSMATLQLRGNWCVSTSGDYERYVEKDGVRYHHIIDPKTGYPADSGIISVTIVSESGILSDALSTACFVLGIEAGLALAEEYGAQAYIVDKDMNVYMTEGMDKLLVLQ